MRPLRKEAGSPSLEINATTREIGYAESRNGWKSSFRTRLRFAARRRTGCFRASDLPTEGFRVVSAYRIYRL